MPRTAITPITPIGPFPALPVAANSLDFAYTAGDAVNGNTIDFGGASRMLVCFQNVNAGAQTFTLQSALDSFNREGDITAYSLAAGEFGAFMVTRNGWRQSDNDLYIDVSHADVKIAAFLVM